MKRWRSTGAAGRSLWTQIGCDVQNDAMIDLGEGLQPPAWLVRRDVVRLRETLGELPAAAGEPALVTLTGLPGTGKSFFAARLREALGGRAVVLESDALRKALVARPTYSLPESARLFGA